MSRVVWRNEAGDLVIEQKLGAGLLVLRYGLGGAILAAGAYMGLMMIEGPISFFRDQGAGGLLAALPGFLVSALLAAMLLPLGAWICLMRKRWRLNVDRRELVEELDWRIRRTRNHHALEHYAVIWVGLDALTVSSGSREGSPTPLAQVRLLPRDRRVHPVIDIAFIERDRIDTMKALAALLSDRTGLPVEIEAASTKRTSSAATGAPP